MPRVAAAMLRHRLTPAAFQRSVVLSEYFDVASAKTAGFFDALVDPAELLLQAKHAARQFLELDLHAHTKSKRRIRASLIRNIRFSVLLDLVDAAMLGLRGTKPR
jgi:enoyl-CoA hydratase